MNDSKTEVLVIHSSRNGTLMPISKIEIGDDTIHVASKARNIGVIFDSHFQLTANIKAICRKSYWNLKKIASLRPYLNQEALKKLVHAMITSNLDYCNSLLIGLPQQSILLLQRVQNAAARMITCTSRRESARPLLRLLHWLPVQQRVEFKVLVFIYKCLHGLAPPYLEELIKLERNTRTLRSTGRIVLHVPFTRSALAYDRAFSYAGPRLWNSLPQSVQESESLNIFKAKLKTYLFANLL